MEQPISVVILTYNEEINLEKCLKSVAGLASEIFVVDSYSTDKTLEIAKKYDARVMKHRFENHAQQFNWALDNLDIKGDWILKLDADEYLTPELAEEIRSVIRGSTSPAIYRHFEVSSGGVEPYRIEVVNGFSMKRRVYFMNRWIRHGGYYPVWFLRLWRRGKGRAEERKMDEHIILSGGETRYLEHDFVDDNKNGLSRWMEKHKDYASREAEEVRAGRYGAGGRRNLYYRLPPFIRVLFYFLYRYFFRLGFLDGGPGLIFHFLHGFWFRFLVDAKIYGIGRRQSAHVRE